MDYAGSIFVGIQTLSQRPIRIQTGDKQKLDIGSGKQVARMHFVPFGDSTKKDSKVLDVMALGADDILRIAQHLKEDKERGAEVPEYLYGTTNKEMADFAIRHAGFHTFTYAPKLGERLKLVRDNAKEKLNETRDKVRAKLGLEVEEQEEEYKDYDIILSTDELIKRIPELEKKRGRVIQILEKRKGYSLKDAREKAIWDLFRQSSFPDIYSLAQSHEDLSNYRFNPESDQNEAVLSPSNPIPRLERHTI